MIVQLNAIQEKIEEYGDHFKISRTVKAINIACEDDNNSGILIGHSKALIESIAKTILTEQKISYDKNDSVNSLVKKAISNLGIADNVENASKTKSAYKKLLGTIVSQFETATSCYAELRNDFCPMAHGKSSSHIPLDFSHALMVVRHVDAMAAFIMELYFNNPYKVADVEVFNSDQKESFNEQIDDEFGDIKIYGDNYLAHNILEELNPDKYKEALREYIASVPQEESYDK